MKTGWKTTTLGLTAALTTGAAQADDITFTNWFYGGGLGAAFDAYTADFLVEHPDVSVRVETIPFPRYHDVLNVRIATGTPPDVAFVLAGMGPALMEAGRLLDLSPYIAEAEGYDLADFGPAIEPWTRDGAIFAVPFTNASNAVYYNIGLFEAAGIPTPDEMKAADDWTWQRLREVAETLQEDGGARYGFAFANPLFTAGWQNLVDILAPYGGAPWSEDGATCRLTDPGSIEAISLVHAMMFEDGSHPAPGVQFDFMAGDIGMALTRPTFAYRLADVPFEWGVITAPEGPEGFVPSRAQNILVSFSDAANPELGARYIVNATDPANAALWTASAPPRLSLQTLELMEPNNALRPEQLEAAVIPAMQSERFELEYSHINYGPLQSEIQRLFGAHLWIEDADVAEAMAITCAQIEQFLE
jgi:multiple sugar transport system substrate-binding protein